MATPKIARGKWFNVTGDRIVKKIKFTKAGGVDVIALETGKASNPPKKRKRRAAKKTRAVSNRRTRATHRKRTRNGARGNGYVVYPDSVGKHTLPAARKEAMKQSRQYGSARVEDADTQKTVARYSNGRPNPKRRKAKKKARR